MNRFAKQLRTWFSVFVLICTLPTAALAAIPDRPANNGTILDEAGVLSDTVEQKLTQKNETLFEDTGAEIAVVCVDFLDGEEIDDYAYDLFNEWGIGSSERNNGLLLLLAIAEDNYYALPGYGIEDTFSGGTLQTMLDDYLEDDFAAGDYESGVEKFYDAAYELLADYTYTDDAADSGYLDEDSWLAKAIVWWLNISEPILLVLEIILVVFSGLEFLIILWGVLRFFFRRIPPDYVPPDGKNTYWNRRFSYHNSLPENQRRRSSRSGGRSHRRSSFSSGGRSRGGGAGRR